MGFPDAEHILITKTDFAILADYLLALRQWVEVADGCLKANQ